MDETYEFIFSLYYNDLVHIKKGENQIVAYYKSTDRTNGAISILKHDGSQQIDNIGVQRLEIFEKYEVDILGNYHKVKNEKRKGGIKSKK